ncbi:MAG: hypothetical protein D3908_09025 [Candidatus Electrothrix sp. AUS4]|nr:hypothetical protein [Candidatus Electrothrix sp. AUS4]
MCLGRAGLTTVVTGHFTCFQAIVQLDARYFILVFTVFQGQLKVVLALAPVLFALHNTDFSLFTCWWLQQVLCFIHRTTGAQRYQYQEKKSRIP